MSQTILERVASGDASAVDECLSQYGGLVWSLARRFHAGHADAEDAVQEIFIEIWRNAGRFDARVAAESTFITMIARRRLIDRYRKHKRTIDTTPVDEQQIVSSAEQPDHVEMREEADRARAGDAATPPGRAPGLGTLGRPRHVAEPDCRVHRASPGDGQDPCPPGDVAPASTARNDSGGKHPWGDIMNAPWQSPEDRLLELLADRATLGLDVDEDRQLQQLLSENPDFDESCMDRVAAGVQLALLPAAIEPLPAGLRARIKSDAPRHLAHFQLSRAIPQSGRDHR